MSDQERIEAEKDEDVEAHRRKILASEEQRSDDDESEEVEAHKKKL